MHRQLEDLKALAAYLADVREAIGTFRASDEEGQLTANAIGRPLEEIERFVEGAAERLERFIDAQSSALRSSRGRYRDLVDHLPVAIFVNRNDRIVLANAACVALLGARSAAELLGRSPLDFVPAEDHGSVREQVRALRADGAAVTGIARRFRRLDGSVVETELAASVFEDRRGTSIHFVVRDVTEQRRAAAHIAHLNAMLQGVRRVGQLVTRERSAEALLRKAAEIMVETRGLASAVILLEDPRGLRIGAAAGSGERLRQLTELFVRADPPACVARAAAGETVVIRDPAATCAGCPCAGEAEGGHEVICLPLSIEGRRYGILHAVLPPGASSDAGETALLSELASDVAFALRGIELESQVDRAQQSLRESEERYRTDFEHSATGRSLSTPDGRIIRVNHSLASMLGFVPEALTGRRVEELIHLDDRGRSRDLGIRLIAGEATSSRCEIRFLRSDGATLWVDLSTTLYRDSAGRPIHFIADAHDITVRKRAEAESVRSWARLETLAQAVSALSTARTVEEVAETVQSAARGMVEADGASLTVRDGEECHEVSEDAIGPLWKGMRFPLTGCVSGWAMLRGEQVAIEDVYADPRVPHAVYRPTFVKSLVMTPAGSEESAAAVGVYWGSRHGATSEELGILRALSDSASVALENVRAYERLRRSEERYRNLIENLDDLVFAVDVEGRLTYVSGAVTRFRFTSREVLGHRFLEFVHPDDREGVERAFAARLVEDLAPYEFRIVDGDGSVRIVRTSAGRVFEGGQLAGLAGVLMDLTAQRSTEDQLRAAQKLDAIGRLAGGVAHDFNNLLTVISSYTGLAAKGLDANDPRRADLAEVKKAGERAAALTRQLLAFSRRQVLQPEVIDLNALVGGTEKMLGRLIGEDVKLRVVPAPGVTRIRADPGQVEQVLMNLAVNARDAMPDGGTLLIEIEHAELDETFVSRHIGARAGPFVRIRVSDTGCGMDPATRERMFEPFFTTKPAGKGTGLGLATVYGIVKQSGGSIWVDSEPGRGSTFDVYFPRADEAPAEPTPSRASSRAEPSVGTLLFVEDDEAIRTLASRVLAEEGYRVLAAAHGGEALLLAQRHRGEIDLVVTDVVMPGMSGKELASRLETLLLDTPILFISGYGHDAISGRGVLPADTLFLPKPFTPEVLLAKVREVLDPAP